MSGFKSRGDLTGYTYGFFEFERALFDLGL